MIWIGRIISAIPVLLLLFSAILKLMKSDAVIQSFAQYGLPEHLVAVIGCIELTCLIIYVIPRTAVLGAILMTGLFGGATVTNLRVGNPSYVATAVLGVLVWAGLYLRDERVRALIPLRR